MQLFKYNYLNFNHKGTDYTGVTAYYVCLRWCCGWGSIHWGAWSHRWPVTHLINLNSIPIVTVVEIFTDHFVPEIYKNKGTRIIKLIAFNETKKFQLFSNFTFRSIIILLMTKICVFYCIFESVAKNDAVWFDNLFDPPPPLEHMKVWFEGLFCRISYDQFGGRCTRVLVGL